MKPRIKHLNGKKISRKVLRIYAYYRANSMFVKNNEAFCLNNLIEFHVYESTGKLPDNCLNFTEFSKGNGYANGKWVARLTQDMIFDDLNGVINKADHLYKTPASISKCELINFGKYAWWWKNMFKNTDIKAAKKYQVDANELKQEAVKQMNLTKGE